jgi:hypothetical protein
MRRKPKISKASNMVAKWFLKHGLSFHHNPTTGMLKRINIMKMKCAD